MSASDTPAAAPYVLSDWEKANYYNGISSDPPELLYRSDLLENPFPVPKGRFPHLPVKTVHGVFNTPLIVIWIATHPGTTTAKDAYEASPDILALLKANGVEGAVSEWYEGAVERL
ncbi:hypothetical protein K466DRAFT_549552 [Polyporus arcularius HHB13444]|uniref:Uncharacterized protein n=1 Tax=Polyporus arcularius HHB13444 TaxID=1314778 RepID=A0A5C3PLT8_9APHY|nr:hypothetical protein K466DRAFT_549552 [Polyporus arcularius HHB13444]